MICPLFITKNSEPMKVAGFMSGSGTNLIKILEYERKIEKETGRPPYRLSLIFSDNKNSQAKNIAEDFGLPHVIHDILDFYASNGKKDKKDLSLRPEFDKKSLILLADYSFDYIALGGYMSIVTRPLLVAFKGRIINVHPADLTVTDDEKRRFTGDHAVALAILAGEKAIHSSTHIVREAVDYGEILMVSAPVSVQLPEGVTIDEMKISKNKALLRSVEDENQERLKEQGDWVIFPRTLEMIAQGRFGLDEAGNVCFDGRAIRGGYRE